MTSALRWNSADLEVLPDDGKRYEIIDGELFVTRAPNSYHQIACGNFYTALKLWNQKANLGRVVIGGGVIFGDSDDVIPDVFWVSAARWECLLDQAGHLQGAPELVIEVLSAGAENERRDKELKLKLYSRYGVQEYWIADWRNQQISIYRREAGLLQLQMTMYADDILTSSLLPDFACPVKEIFE